MDNAALKDFLDRKVEEYNQPSFVAEDPICIPHLFSAKQDREIAGLFAATFAWGNRKTIINKCKSLLHLMDDSPYEFILHHKEKDLKRFEGFCHRTFNTTDLLYFISFLKQHYSNSDSLESAFIPPDASEAVEQAEIKRGGEPVEHYLNYFSTYFFSLEHVPERTRKHVASPAKNSACKRLNMYLRWMVRNDGKGVDFGIWKKFDSSMLICPLDLHVARVARRFKLLDRPNADWLSAVELTRRLRAFDERDPVKYDFALFALGVIEKF